MSDKSFAFTESNQIKLIYIAHLRTTAIGQSAVKKKTQNNSNPNRENAKYKHSMRKKQKHKWTQQMNLSLRIKSQWLKMCFKKWLKDI